MSAHPPGDGTDADSVHAAATAPGVGELEVATLSADALRASIRITGALAPATVTVLTSILRTHVTAGRRYLRVDLGAATVTEAGVVDTLVQAHRDVGNLGGMLVFENAGPQVVDAIRSATLFVQSTR